MRGKFIVLYGINNLGKTTQAKLLVARLQKEGHRAEYLKYGIYDLEPSGKIINDYLRKNNPLNLSPREIQIVHVVNRYQYQPTLIQKLENGINVVAEDYIGTGLAWGVSADVDEQFLKYLNSGLLKEDIAFLFQGKRFKQALENGHKNEADDELIEKARVAHDRLAAEYGWRPINANLPMTEIAEVLWQETQKML